jgi:hypothetical protein
MYILPITSLIATTATTSARLFVSSEKYAFLGYRYNINRPSMLGYLAISFDNQIN